MGSAGQARIGTAVAVLAVAVVAVLDTLTGERAIMIGLTILGPLIASMRSTTRQTIGVSLLTIAAAILLGIPDGIFLESDHLVRLGVLALASAVSVRAAVERNRNEDATRRLAQVAEVAQRAILRPPPAALGDVALAARYVSASEDSLVGGDLYETAYTPYGVRVLLGDVRGKGLEAVQVAATVLGTFREVVWDRPLDEVACALDERIAKMSSEEEFVTTVLVEMPSGGGLRIVNCGHHPPLHLAPDRHQLLEPGEASAPLGLDPRPLIEDYEFEAGDRLLLYTDGLVEARDTHGRFFPLLEHVDALRVPGVQEAVDALLLRLMSHLPGRSEDDVAVFLIERRA